MSKEEGAVAANLPRQLRVASQAHPRVTQPCVRAESLQVRRAGETLKPAVPGQDPERCPYDVDLDLHFCGLRHRDTARPGAVPLAPSAPLGQCAGLLSGPVVRHVVPADRPGRRYAPKAAPSSRAAALHRACSAVPSGCSLLRAATS
jgi:hypothetical protein